jgi:hypothetical protein
MLVLNIALGLTVPLASVIGTAVFIVTVFSVNETIISAGFILTGLVVLGLTAFLFATIRQRVAQPEHGVRRLVYGAAHVLLFLSNMTALIGAPLLVYGFVFRPPETWRPPLAEGLVLASISASALLSVALLIAGRRRTARLT